MDTNKSNWHPTNLIVAIKVCNQVDESAQNRITTDNERHAISRRAEQIIDNAEAIVRNDNGELALLYDGIYYPLQTGNWTVKDFYIIGNFETGEQETRYYDMPYNAYLPYEGIKFLLVVADKNEWEQFNEEL